MLRRPTKEEKKERRKEGKKERRKKGKKDGRLPHGETQIYVSVFSCFLKEVFV